MLGNKATKKGSKSTGCMPLLVVVGIIILCGTIFSSNSSSPQNTHTPARTAVYQSNANAVISKKSTQPPTQTLINLKACATNSINVRKGPGTQYSVIGGLASGSCVKILGRNQDANWIYMVDGDNQTGWVAAWLVTADGNISNVPVHNVAVVLPTYTALAVNPPVKQKTAKPQNSANSGNQGGTNSASSSPSYPAGATAICSDGTYSFSTHRQGTCSHHGGVAVWLQ